MVFWWRYNIHVMRMYLINVHFQLDNNLKRRNCMPGKTLTQGKPWKLVMAFALPVLMGSLL